MNAKRILSVLGALLLCAMIGGNQAWAQNTLSGNYSCTGSGALLNTSLFPFTSSCVMNVTNQLIGNPQGDPCAFDVVGEPLQRITITSKNSNVPGLDVNNQEQITGLTYTIPLAFIFGSVALPEDFNVVADTFVNSVAQHFTMTAIPQDGPQFQLDLTWIQDCRHQ